MLFLKQKTEDLGILEALVEPLGFLLKLVNQGDEVVVNLYAFHDTLE